MKTSILPLIAAAALLCGATACKSRSGEVDALVEQLNSPSFRAAEMKTGLFTNSEAALVADSLKLTLTLVPSLNLSAVGPDQLPALQQTAVEEFRTRLADPAVRAGLEAMQKEGKWLVMEWRDSANRKVSVVIAPSEILKQ